MNCIVTAGPTYEELDQVRRLTNFSSGRLGAQLAGQLAARGHVTTLLRGHYSTCREEHRVQRVLEFTTTDNLRTQLEHLGGPAVGAVFHAAAVSDFTFGKVFVRSKDNELKEVQSGKFSTRAGTLLAELVPTEKVIGHLRDFFPKAFIVGWKYEVEGERAEVIARAREQIRDNRTNACVANGTAYGFGFGLVTPDTAEHFSHTEELFAALERMARARMAGAA
jgi:phosphopantothenoylcysteine decarboxylase/phosphopantothenate--cysteine ligase